MIIQMHANRAQLNGLILKAPRKVSVGGRGTGKSAEISFTMDAINRNMPRSITSITGKTYGQILTRTLPSTLKLLNMMGYQKEVNYVIGKKPPPYFHSSYEDINQFDNVISFSNGTRYVMISQSEKGSGRGANTDYELIDEALTIDREQYNSEVSPTNRGNLEFFGKNSDNYQPMHHGFTYSTSMPISKEQRWVLEYGNYYASERGIRLFETWNRVVMAQVDLLKVAAEYKTAKRDGNISLTKELIHEFTLQWNEIARIKKQIEPFISKEGVLFTLSNAFDNLDYLGIDYILKNQRQLPLLIFMVEIMNLFYDKVEDCFYSLQERVHVYYDSFDVDRMKGQAKQLDYNLTEETYQSCIYDKDCNPQQPLEIVFDWGSSICLMTVHQEWHNDFASGMITQQICQTQINEFFVKPDGSNGVMITELIGKFCQYYQAHPNKNIKFYRDRYGDSRNPNVLNAKTYNEMAIDELKKNGWNVDVFVHPGIEPPMSDKYLLWGVILSEENPKMPKFRINGDKCKYTLISMNNAKVKTIEGNLKKDKSSERKNSGVLPEEATHFSDAVDKIIWTKYAPLLKNNKSEAFVWIH